MKWDADRYNASCGAITEHGRELVEIVRQKNCRRVLDIGSGTGVLAKALADITDEVVGIDSSKEMVEKAKSTYRDIEFIEMDAYDMRWKNHFDGVFSNAVFHFIQNHDLLLDNVYNALTKKGYLICEFGGNGNISEILIAMEQVCTKRGKNFVNRFYYPENDAYISLLQKHHFTPETVVTYDVNTPLKGADGFRNWMRQAFSVEMGWLDAEAKNEVYVELEDMLRNTHMKNDEWYIPNRRIRVVAQK